MNSPFKDHAPKDLKIVNFGDPLYHYARVISNTRFGKMPISIAYCKHAEHVQYCVNYCRDHGVPFRVRSGGHQHEGMCSADKAIIIDLSEIHTLPPFDENTEKLWIPAGKQLGQVYTELAKKGKTIPSGGCQSVNVGGLTQGGGWGVSVRKYGLTCDSVTKIEIVLANGDIVHASEEEHSDLFWALKGGGGGNFGVVIRFEFKLVSILPVTTNFSLQWEKPDEIKDVITKWAELHAKKDGIDEALSATCNMLIVKSPDGKKSDVQGRMGGKFYGSKVELLKLLIDYFGVLVVDKITETTFKEMPKGYSESLQENNSQADFSISSNENSFQSKSVMTTDNTSFDSYAANQRMLIDFINPIGSIQYAENTLKECKNLDLTVLPDRGPSSTCDQPHPHKVSSSFPKDTVNHRALVEAIYDYLKGSCYYADVNMYMSFHCMGGAVTRNADSNAFGYAQKPYMLQIQAWWDDVSNAFTNEGRNIEYLKWVKTFRESIAEHTEGSFINFVDKTLVPDIEKDENRLELLEIYYTKKNLEKLRRIKSMYDPNQLFSFEMSILPE
ncbi:FAD-dependent oxidoreductase [uncultured Kordia sp.]|uniref:FAD-dependent oxidoreductase n=1 Tax=uncultured Kordia sp. TaxID=507699 RepID=UPI00261D272C|nr:FAD-dependent oxidoreductase [uncultured Kordia sp.]